MLALLIITALSWLVLAMGTAFTVRAGGAPKVAFAALLVAGLMFVNHAPPTEPIGMLALLVAISPLEWSERRARLEKPPMVPVPTQGR